MEACHGELMRLYAETGQVSLALRQYRELEELLRQEVGSAPSGATQELIRAIQAQELTQQADRLAQPRQRLASVPAEGETARSEPDEPGVTIASDTVRAARSLPLTLTRFFGREDEIERLQVLLRIEERGVRIKDGLASASRLLTLTGTGGSGKTRLVTEAAQRWIELLHCLVWFVPLADLSDAALIPNAVADVLGLPRLPHVTPEEQVHEALNRQPALLILDNFEHLLNDDTGTQFVQRLIAGVPTLRCLVTSRHRLELDGEQEFPIAPLPTPETGFGSRVLGFGDNPLPTPQPTTPRSGSAAPANSQSPAPALLLTFPSVQLFVDRAQAARPDFQVTARNADDVAALCAGLEGLPLAIELAAARSQVLTPSQMLAQVSHRFDFLVSRHRDREVRHTTLRAVVDWSYRLLSPELQRFFRQLSVFRGGWTLDAASAVSGEALTLDWLSELRDGSLLGTEESGSGEMRYRMLETMREYAQEQMSVEEASALGRRHAEYYTALAEVGDAQLKGAEQKLWMERLEADHDNLRAAFDWSLSEKEEGERRKDESGYVPDSSFLLHPSSLALHLAGALARFWFYGHLVEGRERLATALARSDPSERTAERAKALLGAGMLDYYLGDYVQARALCTESLEISRELGDRAGMAIACIFLGNAEAYRQHGAGRPYYEQSLALFRELGDAWGIAYALNNLGQVAYAVLNDRARARALYEESLGLRRALGDSMGIAMSLNNLGLLARNEENYAEARALFEESLSLVRELGNRHSVASVLFHLSDSVLYQGDYAAALYHVEESVALFREMADRAFLEMAQYQLSRIHRKRGDLTRAQAALEERLTLAKALKSPHRLLSALACLGEVLIERGDYPSARAYLRQSMHTALEDEADARRYELPELLRIVVALATAQGQPELAVRLLGAASAHQEILGPLPSHAEADFQARVDAPRQALGEAAFATVWEAGRALDSEQALALLAETVRAPHSP
jgi:predicted ATPase